MFAITVSQRHLLPSSSDLAARCEPLREPAREPALCPLGGREPCWEAGWAEVGLEAGREEPGREDGLSPAVGGRDVVFPVPGRDGGLLAADVGREEGLAAGEDRWDARLWWCDQ